MKTKAIRYALLHVLMFFVFAFLVSCDNDTSSDGDTDPSTLAASITLTANPSSLAADNTSSSVITATLKDSSDTAVPSETPVAFSTTLGTFSNGATTYNASTPDSNGTVTV